jgi:hypothetical protein
MIREALGILSMMFELGQEDDEQAPLRPLGQYSRTRESKDIGPGSGRGEELVMFAEEEGSG